MEKPLKDFIKDFQYTKPSTEEMCEKWDWLITEDYDDASIKYEDGTVRLIFSNKEEILTEEDIADWYQLQKQEVFSDYVLANSKNVIPYFNINDWEVVADDNYWENNTWRNRYCYAYLSLVHIETGLYVNPSYLDDNYDCTSKIRVNSQLSTYYFVNIRN